MGAAFALSTDSRGGAEQKRLATKNPIFPRSHEPRLRFGLSCCPAGSRTGFIPLLAFACLIASPAQAHNPDTSYLHCLAEAHELNLRFTLDPATLHRIVRPDANGDGRITRSEMEAVTGEIFDYLETNVKFEVNGEPAKIGERSALGWPVEAGDSIAEKDYHTMLLHFPFRCRSQALIEDFYILYDVFPEFGDNHRVIADIEQGGKHLEVIFTQFEPDYVYDTFLRPERKDVFCAMAERIWGSTLILVVLMPCLIFALLRASAIMLGLAALPGLAVLLWHLREELQVDSWAIPLLGIVVSAVLGVMCVLPIALCLTPPRKRTPTRESDGRE